MRQIKVNQLTYARLFRMLLDDPATVRELVEDIGLHRTTTLSLMRTLYLQGVVHICAWERDKMGRECIPVYKLGTGKDKPRRTRSGKQRQAQIRARKQNASTLLNVQEE